MTSWYVNDERYQGAIVTYLRIYERLIQSKGFPVFLE